MSGLLVSIRDLAEAQTACEQDIAILDVKNPDNGALGAASPDVLQQIAKSNISAEIPKSFSAGELSDWIGLPLTQPKKNVYSSTLQSSFGHVKTGLANMAGQSEWKQAWVNFFESNFCNFSAVAVAYLDFKNCASPSPREIIELASSVKFCDTILFDTYHKSGNLFQHLSLGELNELVRIGKSHSLRTVVAGSVDQHSVEQILTIQPDLIGVRGAVCAGTRTSSIDSDLIRQMVESVS